MRDKVEELNLIISNLKTTIFSLEERVTKEELDKLVSFLFTAFRLKRCYLHLSNLIYGGLMIRMRSKLIEKKMKQGLLVRSCKLLFQQSLKKFSRRNQQLNKR